MLDIANYRSLKEQYDILKVELTKYSQMLSSKEYAIAITRVDALDSSEIKLKIDEFKNSLEDDSAKFILDISSVTRHNLDKLIYQLYEHIK
jgi:GTP-binding protein